MIVSLQSAQTARNLLSITGYLVDMSPVLVIFQAFPEHCHDLIAGYHIVGQIRDISHLRAGWTPWVIRGCLSHLQNQEMFM